MKMEVLVRWLALGACLIGATPASAVPIQYDINGGLFSDGSAFAGNFTYDTSSNSVTAYDVVTNNGTLSAYHYIGAGSGAYVGGGSGPNNFIILLDNGSRYFNFSFASNLGLGLTQSLLTATSYECNNCGTFRMVTAGTVSAGAVPEPATWAMMLLGFGGIGMSLRLRRVPLLLTA